MAPDRLPIRRSADAAPTRGEAVGCVTSMSASLRDQLDRVPLVNRKAELRRGEAPLPKRNPAAGQALDAARQAAQLEPKAMAAVCGVSDSLIRRALTSADDIGFHRLWELSDDFWAELIVAIAKRRSVARVRTTIELDDRSRRRA